MTSFRSRCQVVPTELFPPVVIVPSAKIQFSSWARKPIVTLVNYCENGVCTVYYLQNIGENEDLLSYPRIVIKKGKKANHGYFSQDFHKEFNEHDVFH